MSQQLMNGLDDGPPLPRSVINGWKGDIAVTLRRNGSSLREIAEHVKLSHEGIREILTKRGLS